MRSRIEAFSALARSGVALFVPLALLVAGCSSESSRFDGPFSNPFSSSSRSSDVTGSVPRQNAPPVERRPLPQPQYQSNYTPPPTRPATIAGNGYSPSAPASYQRTSYQPAPYQPAQPAPYQPPASDITGSVARPQPAPSAPAPAQNGNWHWDGGTPITVAPGDTLHSVSNRYGVPAAAIAQANGLAPNAPIHSGQRLVIPRYNYGAVPASATPAPRAPAPQPAPVATAPRATPPVQSATAHVVQPGETLTSIARRYNVRLNDLAAANNIQPYKMVRMGERLVVPGRNAAPAAPQQPAYQRTTSIEPTSQARIVTPAKEQPTDEITASAEPMGTGFRWPVRGRVIAGFGPKPTGQQNDGINLAVPEGTPVKAADDGVVAYAGNELKGYGNLVLIRHANGFVTAYAHASELLVKRGEQIKRGQVIAKSGQTGNVTSPQLHFEIRKGSTPVDPMQHLTGAG
jgi:murein DD-endopeptidase MepM/ murein hydrolase activator NlpD